MGTVGTTIDCRESTVLPCLTAQCLSPPQSARPLQPYMQRCSGHPCFRRWDNHGLGGAFPRGRGALDGEQVFLWDLPGGFRRAMLGANTCVSLGGHSGQELRPH